MKEPRHNDPLDSLGAAYEKMFERVVEGFRKSDDKSEGLIQRLIDDARDTAVELGEVSREEAEKLAGYVRRDLHDFIENIAETGRDWKDWLGFEAILLEAGFLEMLAEAADPTTLALQKLKLDADMAGWHTGEIAGPGTLVCDQCGEKLHFHKTGRIPPCPGCHATSFHRQRG